MELFNFTDTRHGSLLLTLCFLWSEAQTSKYRQVKFLKWHVLDFSGRVKVSRTETDE